MKRIITTFCLLLLFSCSLSAQNRNSSSGYGTSGSSSFEKGSIIISAGYGFPNLGKTAARSFQNETAFTITGFGPMHLKGEYALSNMIGFGLSVNYASMTAKWTFKDYDNNNVQQTYTEKLRYSSYSVLARMNVHFATQEKLDPYWGIGAGFRGGTFRFSSDDPYSSGLAKYSFPGFIPLGFETTVGLRYYITPNVGMYTEIGFSKSIIQAGLVGKF